MVPAVAVWPSESTFGGHCFAGFPAARQMNCAHKSLICEQLDALG